MICAGCAKERAVMTLTATEQRTGKLIPFCLCGCGRLAPKGRRWVYGHSSYRAVIPESVRFWRKVKKTPGCWFWLGARTPNGYGKFLRDGRADLAHRVAYKLVIGTIPDDLQIDHLCRQRHCVNPSHMEPVPQRVNLLRGVGWSGRNAAKTHCPQGHAYTEANTALTRTRYGHQGRKCKECNRTRHAARRLAIASR